MAKGAYQAGTGRSRAAALRSAAPAITISTHRVRLTLAVADAPEPPIGETVTHARDAAAVARAVIGSEISECVLAIFLNARTKVTGYAEVARGTLNAARMTPRDLLVPALLANAHGQAGLQAGHGEIIAWSYEMAAWFALTEGRYHDVIDYARAGQQQAGLTNAMIQLVLQQARGQARLSQRREVHASLDHGARLLDRSYVIQGM
jgi:RadC-like JAB domain